MTQWIIQFIYKWCNCCRCIQKEEVPVVDNNQQDEILQAKQYDLELGKKYRELGFPNRSVNDTAARFSSKLKENRKPLPKIKRAVIAGIDNVNSIVFNQITDGNK